MVSLFRDGTRPPTPTQQTADPKWSAVFSLSLSLSLAEISVTPVLMAKNPATNLENYSLLFQAEIFYQRLYGGFVR